jgi:streptomycin 6-kinase
MSDMEGAPWYELVGGANPLEFAAAGDVEGRAWIGDLPALVDAVCRRWDLAVADGGVHTGYHAVVLPVRRSGERYVLKLTWPPERTVTEARALAAWNGRGAVRIAQADTIVGALLLERLDTRRTLHDLPLTMAAAVAGRMLRRLAVPAPPGFRSLRDVASEITLSMKVRQERLDRPVPTAWLDAARDLSEQLGRRAENQFLVHADLHYGNVLVSEREPWLAIDPRPVAGEPEYAVAELLWTRVDEVDDAAGIRRLLAVLVDSGALDAEKSRGWAIVRCVDYWLWGVEHGLTRDPKRCQHILEALL